MTQQRVDAVVIGAGAGGLCAAARLVHAGLHKIVVDRKSPSGVSEETFHTVGVPLNIRAPAPATSFFHGGKLVDVGRGGWALNPPIFPGCARPVWSVVPEARSGNLPDGRRVPLAG